MAAQKIFELTPQYCDNIPKKIGDGIIYISKRFGIAVHNCACGCGRKTITGFKPHWSDGWTLDDNNGQITLRPSIGNFNGEIPYHAHYYITNGKVQWL